VCGLAAGGLIVIPARAGLRRWLGPTSNTASWLGAGTFIAFALTVEIIVIVAAIVGLPAR
jgi:hypothetical protein